MLEAFVARGTSSDRVVGVKSDDFFANAGPRGPCQGIGAWSRAPNHPTSRSCTLQTTGMRSIPFTRTGVPQCSLYPHPPRQAVHGSVALPSRRFASPYFRGLTQTRPPPNPHASLLQQRHPNSPLFRAARSPLSLCPHRHRATSPPPLANSPPKGLMEKPIFHLMEKN